MLLIIASFLVRPMLLIIALFLDGRPGPVPGLGGPELCHFIVVVVLVD